MSVSPHTGQRLMERFVQTVHQQPKPLALRRPQASLLEDPVPLSSSPTLRKDTALSLPIVSLPSGSSLLQGQNLTEEDTVGRILFLVTQTAILSRGDLQYRHRMRSTDGMLMDSLCRRHLLLLGHVHTKQMRRTTHIYLGTAHQSCHRI
jgi:hypothetical protein